MTDNIIALEEEQWTVERLKALADQREKLEKEIKALRDYLLAPGNPGLKGGLVDKDGFPVCDFEKAYSVREARQQLASTLNFLLLMSIPSSFVSVGCYKSNQLVFINGHIIRHNTCYCMKINSLPLSFYYHHHTVKTNDLKVLMKRIEVGLVEVHRIYREEKERQANQAQTGT